jgi:hypothetical protein
VARTAEVPVEAALKVNFDKSRMFEGQVRAFKALKAAAYFKAKMTKLNVDQHFVLQLRHGLRAPDGRAQQAA